MVIVPARPSAPRSGPYQRREGLADRIRRWWAAGYGQVYGKHAGHPAHGRVIGGINAAPAGAVPQGHDALGIGYGVIGHAQRIYHGPGDRPRDKQDVGMPGAGNETHPDRRQVIEGVTGGLDFEFAAIARAGVDMAYGKRPSEFCGQ